MQAASAFLAFIALDILSDAATSPHDTFRYEISSSVRHVEEACHMCYGDECVDIDGPRCQYFLEMDEIAEEPEDGGEGTPAPVDDMIADLTEQAAMSWLAPECIPFISERTNCNKENLCIGCESCHCSSAGSWICQQVQQCRANIKSDINHRTLAMVMEKLLEDDNKTRKRRFVESEADQSEMQSLGMADIADWMDGVTPHTNVELSAATQAATDVVVNNTESFAQFTSLSPPTESEYLGFEEVMKNIANDQIYKRRKSEFHNNSEVGFDYMDIADFKLPVNNANVDYMKVLNYIEKENVPTKASDSKFVVDLYPRDIKNDFYDDNDTADISDYFNYFLHKKENNTIDLSHEELVLDPINIMKRDTSFVPRLDTKIGYTTNATNIIETTYFKNKNITSDRLASESTTDKVNELQNSVLIPLTRVIDNKQTEIEDLLLIKKALLRIIEINMNNGNNAHLFDFEVESLSEIHEDLRKINPNVMEKLIYKLKRDIYEVFKDINSVQKLSRPGGLPDNLKTLIRAMKHYVNKQESVRDLNKKGMKMKNNNTSRRFWMQRISTDPKSLAKQLVDILDVINKDTSESSDFNKLSKSSKKIIKRVIKHNLIDEFSVIELRVFDTDYNLTNDLRTIGKSWLQLTAKLSNCSPHSKLYAMKLLHLSLAGDMNKLRDAIVLVDFAHSRRMSPVEMPMAKEILARINAGLSLIKNKIQRLVKYQLHREQTLSPDHTKKKNKKKESLFKKIRNMLRSSKKEIVDMAKNNVPKSEIFKTIAQKKLNELAQKKLSDDEQTMLKWQRALRITRRKKRDLSAHINVIKKRMKSIIPNYLRGKLNPVIAKQKSKKQSGKITRVIILYIVIVLVFNFTFPAIVIVSII